ncbi:MAG: C-GCAxxG-C-C family protein [Candidatus Saganbacteria bacterium]|nr:C-GCAxxG-C-C family protein [Candidatus Saganbacteria bacterium]
MPIEKAKKHFLGADGHERLNCAKSIFKVFTDLDEQSRNEIGHGGGRAPGGVCGAYYAANHILARKRPEKLADLEKEFIAAAGSIRCREIRRGRKLPCVDCVGKAAEILHQELKDQR